MLLPMLSAWQWIILGLVPPAITALYFLKLRRQPLSVPSTLLWRKTIEDLHVNSFWQRIRQSLLLYLQLLFVTFIILTLLRPNWETQVELSSRVILLIDNSASMSATDVSPTRLEVAKAKALEVVEGLDGTAVAMVISFSDNARVEKSFSGNRAELREVIANIQPTQHTTNLLEALRQAAGLANPSRQAFDQNAEQVQLDQKDEATAEALPATLYIFSDGRFPTVQGFSLGNLKPVYIPIGDPGARNAGITTFSVRRKDEKAEELQAFAQIENAGKKPLTVKAELLRDGKFWDASQLTLGAGATQSVIFDLRDVESGVLEMKLGVNDALKLDDRAYAVIQEPAPLKILLVSSGNPDLERALGTKQVAKLADVRTQKPEFLLTSEYGKGAASGFWDLIIYDRCKPPIMPRANTMHWGELPPTGWSIDATTTNPQVIDVDRVHPLSQNLDFDEILIANATTLKPPQAAHRLLDTTKGTLMAIAPRDSFEDLVLGFPLLGKNDDGSTGYNSNFHLRPAFPLLVQNLLAYFSRTVDVTETVTLKPGQEIELRQEGAKELAIKMPTGKIVTINRSPRNTFSFSGTDEIGVYQVLQNNKLLRRFAVQLGDSLETNIIPVAEEGIRIGYNQVTGQTGFTAGRREIWKWLLLLGLGFLVLEWYIYNRRVYI
jgi:hypothetical protein